VRGEMEIGSPSSRRFTGSSPRAWGNAGVGEIGFPFFRFIPTCVGKCSDRDRSRELHPVHPHVRGEMNCHASPARALHGSSPRAWGNGLYVWYRPGLCRFIPTCVGKWGATAPGGRPPPVHPHVRGEMIRHVIHSQRMLGSSPRAWGNGYPCTYNRFVNRFIPTCVGKWRDRRPCMPIPPVHPHVRGEMLLLSSLANG